MNNELTIAIIILLVVSAILSIVFRGKFPTNSMFQGVFLFLITLIIIGSITLKITLFNSKGAYFGFLSFFTLSNSRGAYFGLLSVYMIIEIYTYFRLPRWERLWRSADIPNPKYREIRLLVISLLLILCPLLYMFFHVIFEETVRFCTTSSPDEKKKIIERQLPLFAKYGVKGLFLYAVIAAIVLTTAKYGTEFLFSFI